MLNTITLMGRLTKDPELRNTAQGTAVASFSLAVERDYAPNGGSKETDFIDIVAWRSTAEFVSKYFSKGQLVAVTGRLQIRDWTDSDSVRHRIAEVVASNVYFAEAKREREKKNADTERYSTPRSTEPYYATPVTGSDFAELDDDDGDLPF